jgi:hypothetical protein
MRIEADPLPGVGDKIGRSRHRGIVEPGQMAQQRGKSRRRFANERVDLSVPSSTLEIILPQVQQVTFRLHFAGAAEVLASNRQTFERIAAKNDVVIFQNVAVLDGERVERTREVWRGQQERCRGARSLPRGSARGACVEVFERERSDQRQARHRPVLTPSVRHHCFEAIAEDAPQIFEDGLQCGVSSGGHRFILPAPAARSAPCTFDTFGTLGTLGIVGTIEFFPDAASRAQDWLLRRRDGSAEPSWRPEAQSVAVGQCGRHDVRQRRQFRTAAR